MAAELPINATQAAIRNPFRRSHVALALKYNIGVRHEHIEGSRYSTFQRLFTEHTQNGDFISEETVVGIVQVSKLPEDELSDLWEDALKATFNSAVSPETRLGYLNKYEFFVLLAELQAKLGISDVAFSSTFLIQDGPPEPRRNPFTNYDSTGNSGPSNNSPEIQSEPAKGKGVESAKVDALEDSKNSTESSVQKIENSSLLLKQPLLADGYSEYVKTFGAPVMGATIPPDQTIPPSPLLKVAKDEKEAISGPQALDSLTQKYPSLEPVSLSPVRRKEVPSSAGTRPGEIEVVDHTNSNLHHKDMSIIGPTSKSEHSPHPDRDDDQNRNHQKPLSLVKSARSQQSSDFQLNAVPPNIFEVEALVSTSESDELALQCLRALKAEEPHLPPRPTKKQSLTRRLLSKARPSKSSTKGVEARAAASENGHFSLRLLSLALHGAVVDGNIQLVASIFKLGANVNFDCLQPKNRHHFLEVAALLGHTHRHIVNHFIFMGADEVSIGQALISALRAGDLDMALTLVPHANMISLHPWDNRQAQWQICATLFGRIARDTKIPYKTRGEVLKVLIDQEHFLAASTAWEIREILPAGVSAVGPKEIKPILSYNAVQLLISLVDVELVAKVLSKLNINLQDRSFRDWAIPAEQWERTPERAVELLLLLISHSALVDHAAQSVGRNAMTPLAHSVAGGCAQAVALLLELNADPECSIYELFQNHKINTAAYTALGWSAKQGRVDICRLLVGAGAIPWRTDAFHRAPLYWASKHGQFKVVEYLLSLDTQRSSIDDCLVASIEGNYPQIAKILLENGAVVSPKTMEAAMGCQPKPRERSKHLEIIDLLLFGKPYTVGGEAIACAIESNNFAGLSRVLEICHSDSVDGRIKYSEPTRIQRVQEGKAKSFSCVEYAKHKGALDFVSLLEHYPWLNGGSVEKIHNSGTNLP